MKLKFFLFTLFSVLLLLPSVAGAAEVWATGGFEGSPADGDTIAAGAGKMRDTRIETRQRADVEHFWADTDDTSDDNGLHRAGSSRCFFADAAPTILADGIKDYDNAGGPGVADLADPASNAGSAGAEDDVGSGRCWIDTNDGNQMYIYIGVAGADSCVNNRDDGTSSDDCWEKVPGTRVKAGAPNILFNGDFDYNGCTGTDDPIGWTSIDAETVTYETGSTGQGVGCAAVVLDVDGGDGYKQVLTNLKGATTYGVVAQVKEDSASTVCTLSTTGAATNVTGMVSSGTSYVQLEGFFVTSAALDTVTVLLTNTGTADVCTWDHIAVWREEALEVPQAGIVAVHDVYSTSAAQQITGSYVDITDLNIVFVPPTGGYIIQLRANISLGCPSGGDCTQINDGDGVICRLEKGGSEITGTERVYVMGSAGGTSDSDAFQIITETIDINPVAGTSISYTVACKDISNVASDMDVNPTVDSNVPESSLSMIAFPPH